MKTNLGLNEEARLRVGQLPEFLLADESVHCAMTRDHNRKVPAPEFRSPHRQAGDRSAPVAAWTDQIGERARTDTAARAERVEGAGPIKFFPDLGEWRDQAVSMLRAQLETEETVP